MKLATSCVNVLGHTTNLASTSQIVLQVFNHFHNGSSSIQGFFSALQLNPPVEHATSPAQQPLPQSQPQPRLAAHMHLEQHTVPTPSSAPFMQHQPPNHSLRRCTGSNTQASGASAVSSECSTPHKSPVPARLELRFISASASYARLEAGLHASSSVADAQQPGPRSTATRAPRVKPEPAPEPPRFVDLTQEVSLKPEPGSTSAAVLQHPAQRNFTGMGTSEAPCVLLDDDNDDDDESLPAAAVAVARAAKAVPLGASGSPCQGVISPTGTPCFDDYPSAVAAAFATVAVASGGRSDLGSAHKRKQHPPETSHSPHHQSHTRQAARDALEDPIELCDSDDETEDLTQARHTQNSNHTPGLFASSATRGPPTRQGVTKTAGWRSDGFSAQLLPALNPSLQQAEEDGEGLVPRQLEFQVFQDREMPSP